MTNMSNEEAVRAYYTHHAGRGWPDSWHGRIAEKCHEAEGIILNLARECLVRRGQEGVKVAEAMNEFRKRIVAWRYKSSDGDDVIILRDLDKAVDELRAKYCPEPPVEKEAPNIKGVLQEMLEYLANEMQYNSDASKKYKLLLDKLQEVK